MVSTRKHPSSIQSLESWLQGELAERRCDFEAGGVRDETVKSQLTPFSSNVAGHR